MAEASESLHMDEAGLVRLIPRGASLTGAVSSADPQQLLLEGNFAGRMELRADSSRIVVAAGAQIDAEFLRAHTVVVRGEVKGTIQAQEVEIAATATVSGAVHYGTVLSVAPGARVRATIETSES